nr:hypothetical protein CFP56_38819 [Quercus suber]
MAATKIVSSSSDSSSTTSSRGSSPAPTITQNQATQEPMLVPSQVPSSSRLAPVVDYQQQFEDLYLRQVTRELGDDLVKLRNANDFSAGSVDVLVAALRQGTACFGSDEKVRIGGGGDRWS